MRTATLTSIALGLLVIGGGVTARAQSNDITLHRFGECQFQGDVCTTVDIDEEGFYAFTRDLGLTFAPPLATTGETLGPAGFAIQFDQSFVMVDGSADYWQRANLAQDPSDMLPVTFFRVRKGLPMSLELGASIGFLWHSELVAINSEIRWALHEDTLWPVPDIAVRAYVSTLLGHSNLQLTTVGGELVVGVPIGIANVMNISPYAGYNLAAVISSSRVIDATPMDPRPPVRGGGISSQPEFVFDVNTNVVHQGLFGLRLQVGVSNILFQGTWNAHTSNYTVSYALEF